MYILSCILFPGSLQFFDEKRNFKRVLQKPVLFHVLRSDEQWIICWKRSYVHVLLLLVLFQHLYLIHKKYIYKSIIGSVLHLPCASKNKLWYDPMISLTSTYIVSFISLFYLNKPLNMVSYSWFDGFINQISDKIDYSQTRD